MSKFLSLLSVLAVLAISSFSIAAEAPADAVPTDGTTAPAADAAATEAK